MEIKEEAYLLAENVARGKIQSTVVLQE